MPQTLNFGRRQALRWGQIAFLPCIFGCLGIWAWVRWQSAPILFESRSQLPQHDRIQAYFNHNPLTEYKDPYRGHQRPGDNLEQIIIEQIKSAQSRIDVAVQELRSPLIAKVLRDRHRAGVQVRLILENTYSRAWSDYSAEEVALLDERLQSRYRENFRLIDHNQDEVISSEEASNYDAIKILASANIPVVDDTEDGSVGSGLVHHKFLIVDEQIVVTTSANFTLSDLHGDSHNRRSQGNANSLLVIKSADIAQAFRQEFELLWGDGPGGTPNSQFGVRKPHRPAQQFSVGDALVWIKFSPDSARIPWEHTSNGFIRRQIQRSKRNINLALFVFSEQKIADQLAIAHHNGVQIKALIDRSFAFRPYSEGLDMLGVTLPQVQDQACQVEAHNRPWTKPIQTVGTPNLSSGDLLHHKFGVIDESVVIIGSHNWSAAANSVNDETLIAIAHPTIAAHYQQEFDRLYTNSRLGLPADIAEKWQTFQRQCSDRNASPLARDDMTPINLNTASAEALQSLPGIGEKTAQAIIATRETHPFQSLEDLDQVPGIGTKTLEKLRDRVTW